MIGALILLGLANHQVAHLLTTSVLFEDLRGALEKTGSRKLGYFAHCHTCVGMWIGLIESLVAAPVVFENQVVNFLVMSFVIAALGRGFNEVLAIMSTLVSYINTLSATVILRSQGR